VVLFFVILCSTLSLCNGNDESLTLECLKKYLKDRNINEDILSYVNPYVGSLTDCESAVKTKLASLYSDLRNKLSTSRSQRPFVDCAMRDIEEEDDESYEHIILREAAVGMISNWRFWSYFSKSSKLEDLRNDAKRVVDKSLLKCKGHRDYGELFNNIQDKTVSWNRSGEEEYCIRNHLVAKKIVRPEFYGFHDNPRNVRTETLECSPIVSSIVNKIYEEFSASSKVSGCSMDVYRKNNYADHLLKAELYSKLSLSKSDRSREKQDFINAIVSISYDTQKC
jgi:hypothetical protein